MCSGRRLAVGALLYVACGWLVGCSADTTPRTTEVSYRKDVRPILDSFCVDCHLPTNQDRTAGMGYMRSQFSVETYESIMRGTKFGLMIKPGDPAGSTLMGTISSSGDQRHHGRGPIPEKDASILHNWIAQGAKNN